LNVEAICEDGRKVLLSLSTATSESDESVLEVKLVFAVLSRVSERRHEHDRQSDR